MLSWSGLHMLTLSSILLYSLCLLMVGFLAGYYAQQRHMLRLLSWKELFYITFFPMKDNVEIKGNHVVINYFFRRQKHRVYVPYSPSQATKFPKATLIYSDGEMVDITHQPGVKYSLSARELSADKILIHCEDEEVLAFSGSQVPSF